MYASVILFVAFIPLDHADVDIQIPPPSPLVSDRVQWQEEYRGVLPLLPAATAKFCFDPATLAASLLCMTAFHFKLMKIAPPPRRVPRTNL